MKIATDLEQSKKLAKFLSIESADMFYECGMEIETKEWGYDLMIIDDYNKIDIGDIPAWSLSKLMDILPIQFDWEFKTYIFKMQTDFYSNNSGEKYYGLGYQGAYGWLEYEDSTELVDACVNLIIKLHERELI